MGGGQTLHGSRGRCGHGGGGAVQHAAVRTDHLFDVVCDSVFRRGLRAGCTDRHSLDP